jgi:hypothetical protein
MIGGGLDPGTDTAVGILIRTQILMLTVIGAIPSIPDEETEHDHEQNEDI